MQRVNAGNAAGSADDFADCVDRAGGAERGGLRRAIIAAGDTELRR
jgi:hypothetical protein